VAAPRCSKATAGSGGRKGCQRGSVDGGQDEGGEAQSKKGRMEPMRWSSSWAGKKQRRGSNYGMGWWRFDHRCRREIEGRGGALAACSDGRMGMGGEKGRWRRRVATLFKWHGGGAGERGGGSVARRDTWIRGWGGRVRPAGDVSTDSGPAVTHASGAALSEQGSTGGL
jgi:hypothetical protein